MTKINFYDEVDEKLFKFAVIITKSNNQWVFCKHKDRDTYEVPGGHREAGEDILETAKRELNEETGATDFNIKPICAYSVTAPNNFDGQETFGMLYYADIKSFDDKLCFEIYQWQQLRQAPGHRTGGWVRGLLGWLGSADRQ